MMRTLLLSGSNNHDWRRTTPYCQALLESTGYFAVDVSLDPGRELQDAFDPAGYDLIFTDYNGPDWPEAARHHFIDAIRAGAGLLVLHAANNAFPDWPEYGQAIGLRFLPPASGHGEFHRFRVEPLSDHPIAAGLDPFFTFDELYHGMLPMEETHYEIVASAYSDPARGGSGKREPAAIALRLGAGRVFHMLLGHVWPEPVDPHYRGHEMTALENEGFGQLLLRGCLWAAGGDPARLSV
ncbi:ThuA domain-containing protein [Cohnella sp. GCM10012308]|uniref:ThuA domain-containing protein n=1 Tax=Cohnella sp. GCM10012308 TaxID=3317329 RepID=UPI00360D86FF